MLPPAVQTAGLGRGTAGRGVRPETLHASCLFLNPPVLELLGPLLGQDSVPLGLAPVVWEVLWWGAGCPNQLTHTSSVPRFAYLFLELWKQPPALALRFVPA